MSDLVPEVRSERLQSLVKPLDALRRLIGVAGRTNQTLIALALVVCVGGVLAIAAWFFRSDPWGTRLTVFAMIFLLAGGVMWLVLQPHARPLPAARADAASALEPKVETRTALVSGEAPIPGHTFDIFFAHQHDNWRAVVLLAQHFKRWGYRVFPSTGEVDELSNQAISRAHCGLILLTPEALQSAWAGAAYERMAAEMRRRAFPIVTITWGSKSSLPADESLMEVHIGNDASLQTGLRQLRQLLLEQGVRPDGLTLPEPETPTVQSPIASAASSVSGRAFVQSVFEQLNRDAILLLAQEDRLYGPVLQELLRIAESRYGAAHVQQLVPLFSVTATPQQYFSSLGVQCGFENATPSAAMFEDALRSKLSSNGPWLLLINGVESSAQQGRDRLALVLRSIHQVLHRDVHVLLLGGHRVVEMNFTGKGLSPLQFAVPREWPALALDDIRTINEAGFGKEKLVPSEVEQLILQVSGGHPRLAQFCLAHFHETGHAREEQYQELLFHHPYLQSLLLSLKARKGFATALRRYADQPDLGPAKEVVEDQLVRLLYWKNLVTRTADTRGARFKWRCDSMRALAQSLF